MRLPTKTLAAALMAAAVPFYTGPAAAAPLSQSLALNSADVGTVEQVQYRRWHSGRWIGPAAGIAAGVAIGGALAPRYYDDGYYAYGAAPGYYVEPATPTAPPRAITSHRGTGTAQTRDFVQTRNMVPARVIAKATALPKLAVPITESGEPNPT